MELGDSVTLGDARARVRARAAAGVDCPLCRRKVKVYRRKLNSNMVGWLARFHKATDGNCEWAHATHVVDTRNSEEYSKLAHWGLIEKHPKTVGFWRETSLGVAFLRDKARVPTYAVVYNRECLHVEGDPISVREALGRPFRIDELMQERPLSREPQ